MEIQWQASPWRSFGCDNSELVSDVQCDSSGVAEPQPQSHSFGRRIAPDGEDLAEGSLEQRMVLPKGLEEPLQGAAQDSALNMEKAEKSEKGRLKRLEKGLKRG